MFYDIPCCTAVFFQSRHEDNIYWPAADKLYQTGEAGCHSTCWPLRECRMVRLPEFFRVKMMTLPVWLNRGAPATSRRPFLADTTDVTV